VDEPFPVFFLRRIGCIWAIVLTNQAITVILKDVKEMLGIGG
jgi:hypothetical protein